MKDPLDSEKTMMNLENSLGDMPTLRLDDTSIGRVDRYELLEKLGEGGFGAVYGARDTEAGILVALKALPGEISCDAEEMAQIRDNFALVSRLHHPNIASVLHLHRVEDADERAQTALGVHESDYLVVMEYALGATLFSMRRALPGQKMEFVQALEICRPIAEALDYAHSQKVLHRDIKPKNIMVAPSAAERGASSTVKVLDFGLAAEIRSSMSRKSKDLQQSKSGTPFYMAPEQWRGVSQGPATDQYALAAMLYEQVSGAVPFKSAFDSGNFEIMRNAACNEPVPALKELTKKQNAVLLRALAKDPDERFASCGDFIAALGGGPVSRKSAKGSKKLVAGLLVAGLLAGGIYAFKDAEARRSRREFRAEFSPKEIDDLVALLREPPMPQEGKIWEAKLGGGVTMDFMPIAAGSFQMGSNNGDSDEQPVHRVTLSQPYWLAKTEVTQAQWQQIMGSNPSLIKGSQNPVEMVSWNNAVSFCKKLTERERQAGRLPAGFEYTLPTEAQWEYACRAGTTGDYAGSLDAMGWYDKNSGKKTHPAGTKQANAWGLYDMHGNVYEWCSDWKGDYSWGSVTDPGGARSGAGRVIRGGSWYGTASSCRSANRHALVPSFTYSAMGFRPLVQRR